MDLKKNYDQMNCKCSRQIFVNSRKRRRKLQVVPFPEDFSPTPVLLFLVVLIGPNILPIFISIPQQ
jgi:hypothetical protein